MSVHSLTLPRTSLNSREYVVTLGLPLGPHPCGLFTLAPGLPSLGLATLQPLCLGRKPKARVATLVATKVAATEKHSDDDEKCRCNGLRLIAMA